MLPQLLRGRNRGLIVCDSASTNRAKEMKSFLAERNIDQIMIPAGMTCYLQTLDIGINKPFKDHLRKEVNEYIEKRMVRNERGNFVKPNLQEIVNWVKHSWEKITDNCVSDTLRRGYLDKSYSFNESFIAKHEKFGSMILKEIEMKENLEGIENLKLYDDIPEDDDLIVFE